MDWVTILPTLLFFLHLHFFLRSPDPYAGFLYCKSLQKNMYYECIGYKKTLGKFGLMEVDFEVKF